MFEALVECMPQAFIVVSETGQLVLFNTQVEAMFGYARAALQNQPIELLTPAYAYQSYLAMYKAHQNNASPVQSCSFELQGRDKNGREFPVEVSFNLVSTDKGTQLLIAMVDMSERKQAVTEISEIHHCLLDHQLAERLQWAHKLHNGPIQDLQGINFALMALANAPEVTQHIGSELTQMRMTVQQIARELRDMQNELCPPTLASFGLAVTIQSYVKTLQKRYPALAIQLNLAEDSTRLSPPVRTALFYACQQALTNVVQHAAAQQVQVRLTLDDALVQLAIIDDGCGFDVPLHWITIVREKRLGLAGVMERAEAVKGICQIVSAPGKGTTLSVIAPILFHP